MLKIKENHVNIVYMVQYVILKMAFYGNDYNYYRQSRKRLYTRMYEL